MSEKQYMLDFFAAIDKLKEVGIIRSDRYLGDIGEYICSKLYGVKLNESLRAEGYDGKLNGEKYEIKFHNSKTRTNIYLGNPKKYDVVLVVLGPNSRLNPTRGVKNEFIVYKFKSCYVRAKLRKKSGYSAGKRIFKNKEIDEKFELPGYEQYKK